MNDIMKLSGLCLTIFALVLFHSAGAQAAGPYSCTNTTYGSSGPYSSSYATCSSNNTANQASTVATATTVLRAASTQTAKMVSGRIAGALGGNAGTVNIASNGFTASTGLSGGNMNGKAGVWVSGSWASVEDSNTDTAFDGDVYTGIAGVDYLVAPGVVVGLSVGYEDVDIDTGYNDHPTTGQDGSLQGDGYTIAPYVGVKFSDKMSGDLTVGYSDLEYDTTRFDPNTGNTITGSTDADRYFINAAVNGRHDLRNNWGLNGRAAVFYASEDKDAFTETESNGSTISVADNEVELGQFLVDARITYDYQQVQPYALVGVEWDFTKDDVPVATTQTVSDDDFGVKLGGGVNLINTGSNVTGGIEAYTVEGRDDYDEYVVSAGLRVQF